MKVIGELLKWIFPVGLIVAGVVVALLGYQAHRLEPQYSPLSNYAIAAVCILASAACCGVEYLARRRH